MTRLAYRAERRPTRFLHDAPPTPWWHVWRRFKLWNRRANAAARERAAYPGGRSPRTDTNNGREPLIPPDWVPPVPKPMPPPVRFIKEGERPRKRPTGPETRRTIP